MILPTCLPNFPPNWQGLGDDDTEDEEEEEDDDDDEGDTALLISHPPAPPPSSAAAAAAAKEAAAKLRRAEALLRCCHRREPSTASCSVYVGQQQGTHIHHAIGPRTLTSCSAVNWPSTSSPVPCTRHDLTASIQYRHTVRPLDLEPSSTSQPEVCHECFHSAWQPTPESLCAQARSTRASTASAPAAGRVKRVAHRR